jgi:hypothetical protein
VPPAPEAILAAAATLPVAVRRVWPLPVLVIVVAAVSVLTLPAWKLPQISRTSMPGIR